jgi:hypothetical protein
VLRIGQYGRVPGSEAAPTKSDEQQPVPSAWRPTFEAIVNAFIAGDWQLSSAPASVERLPEDIAQAIQQNVADYGGITLTALPAETWETSVAIWMGTVWEVLVDLWSIEEGRTDLVIDAKVAELDDGYAFKVHFVYVP